MSASFNYRFCAVIGLLFIITNHVTVTAMSRPSRNSDVTNMADAVKYLQDLDSYYASVARPRFGKRYDIIQQLKERSAAAGPSAPEYNDLAEWIAKR